MARDPTVLQMSVIEWLWSASSAFAIATFAGVFSFFFFGLVIAQAIAHRHGGTIRVTSTVGVGSAFIVALPLAHSALAALPDDGSSTPTGEAS